MAAASFVRGEVDVPQRDGTANAEYLSRATRLFGHAGLRYSHRSGWWLMPQLRWSAEYDKPAPSDAKDLRTRVAGGPNGSMPGFGVFDVLSGWTAGSGKVYGQLRFEKLLDKTYRDVGSAVDCAGRGVLVAVRGDL